MRTYFFSLFVGASVVFLSAGIPFFALAQSGNKDTVQGFIILITQFIGGTLLPLLFSVALLFFLVNAARYFVIEGDGSEGQEKAKTLALYGIGAFVFLISLWGIVNMIVEGFEIDDTAARCPDYLGTWCATRNAFGNLQNNFQYFNNNNESYFGEFGSPNGAQSQSQTFRVYDQNGNLVGETKASVTGPGFTGNSSQTVYVYDQYGNITGVQTVGVEPTGGVSAGGNLEPPEEEEPININEVVN